MDVMLLLGKYTSILHRAEQKRMSEVMKKYDLVPSSYSFLVYLSYNEGINQKELCQLLAIDNALATRTMTKLEDKGYIVRIKNYHDGRAFKLYLTDKSKNLVPELKTELHNWWNKITSTFQDEQKKMLVELLAIMTKDI